MKTLLVAMMFCCTPIFALVPAGVGCAATAEAAVARLIGQESDLAASGEGFRVVGMRTDFVHAKKYALVASCSNAARPLTAVEVRGTVAVVRTQAVRIGDRIKVIAGGSDSHMELTGRAQDSGSTNDVIRVQMPKFSEDAETAPVIRCRIVGNDIVEVIR